MKVGSRALMLILALGLVVSVIAQVRCYWREQFQWKTEMIAMAGYAGAAQAVLDYQSGIVRLYEVGHPGQEQVTGREQDGYEIWIWSHHDFLGYPGKLSAETFVEFYNMRMKTENAQNTQK